MTTAPRVADAPSRNAPDGVRELSPLVARTVRIGDPGPLLALLPEPSPLAPHVPSPPLLSWVRRGEGLVGWGEVARIDVTGPDRFAQAQRAWNQLVAHAAVRDDVQLPGTGPLAFGTFSFAGDERATGTLVVPRLIVGSKDGQWWLTTVGAGAVLPATSPPHAAPRPASPGLVSFADGALSPAAWQEAVALAIARIGAGEVDKVVLARDVEVRTEHPIDPRHLLRRLAERYPRCWTFNVDGLVGATPELLIRRERGLVTSRVLAGTIQRTGDDEHDLALAASLARSSKDLEEHEYAARSVAEALAPHCQSMTVPETPFVLHLANVMHLATDVTGVLAAALHPSAAVCGTPTAEASRVIDEVEHLDRAHYAGPVGWLDSRGDGEWGIALRCAELDQDDHRRLRLFAGCGIVAGSDPDAELAESVAKLIPMREALSSD
jgi:menaquinone-specific isochorismate synthase